MPLTLIGYRATGKSTIAPALALRLGWTAVDADEEIERRAGKPIRDIFADDGEPAFRRLERTVLADLLARPRTVIAAGGGAVLDADTRREMQAAGPVVWLQASLDTILQRIGDDATTASRRPSLTGLDLRTEVEMLLAHREPLYGATATVVVDTDGRPTGDVVSDILVELEPLLAGEAPL